jgi:two-component system chemotaxis response regulator CheY
MSTVLIVDDEPFLQEMYGDMLDHMGIEVAAHAGNGAEAVDAFTRMGTPPSLILMDYRMPHMNGIEATKRILDRDPEARILFVSADTTVVDEALDAGALGFLVKPFTIKALKQAILDILE